ncbi:UNVERIFIED_CONTAM: hypothetical protein H355_016194 [Colinus virginianus]|nr:hypothetical protein H355_016194 [Colinus virginianus]
MVKTLEAFREHRLLSVIGFLIAGKCPQLDTEFADVAAEAYPLKTKLRYECDNGYRRRSGISLTIRCQNISGTASWVYNELVCIGFCGMPKTVPHASLSVQQQYSVGQELHFKCLTGYNKQLPESGIITCKNVNGRIIWSPRDAPCTSNSSPVSKQLSPLIEAGHCLPFAIPLNAIRMKELTAIVEIIHQHAGPRTEYNLLRNQRL